MVGALSKTQILYMSTSLLTAAADMQNKLLFTGKKMTNRKM